jgi:hypothetical protein
MLSFVSTNAATGDRFIMGPVNPPEHETHAEWLGHRELVQTGSISIGTASNLSARFPYITPAGVLKVDMVEQLGPDFQPLPLGPNERLLVDGGFFEDSGAETAIDLIDEIDRFAAFTQLCNDPTRNKNDFGELRNDCRPLPMEGDRFCELIVHVTFNEDVAWNGCDEHVFIGYLVIARMSGTPAGSVMGNNAVATQSFWTDPIGALLAVRTARGNLALSRVSRQLCERRGCGERKDITSGEYHFRVDEVDGLKLPLAWTLSERTVNAILDVTIKPNMAGKWDPLEGESRDYAAERARLGAQAQQLASLFDPALWISSED